MERYFYDTKRPGDLTGLRQDTDNGADATANLEGCFVYDGKRGCAHVMAVCEDRDDAERIVAALNATVGPT
jgi:hypothetical protein